MADPVIVFITGAGRGIGQTLAQTYLSKPNHIVIGSIRNESSPGVQELKASSAGTGSKLLLVKIESESFADPAKAVKELEAAGIDHLDIVIANAASAPPMIPLETVDISDVTSSFNVNALGPLVLFQAVRGLLEKSTRSPTWVSVTSAVGSIGAMEAFGSHFLPAYGISKAALNWITLSAHCGNKWLTAFAVHPGLVQTDQGNAGARSMGMEKAPITKEHSVEKIIGLIENGTRAETSGKFYNAIEGNIIPW